MQKFITRSPRTLLATAFIFLVVVVPAPWEIAGGMPVWQFHKIGQASQVVGGACDLIASQDT